MNLNREPGIWGGAQAQSATAVDTGLRSYMLGVYNYMGSALVLTGIFAWLGANYAPLMNLLYHVEDGRLLGLAPLGWVVVIAPMLLVFGLSAGINRLSFGTAQALFWGFAALMGLSLSSIFFAYTAGSITRVFFITAVTFGSLSLYGYSTKRDLGPMGTFLFMGLIGLIVASVVSMFVASGPMSFAISVIGVLLFAGYTAYDTQRIKLMYYQVQGHAESVMKASLMGALALYMDFINMFIMLLRFFGDRR